MITDPAIREQGYHYFLEEAPELLQTIENELLTIREGYSVNKIHNLMRATHTLKGSSANVGLEVIKTVAHYLEDVIKALYNPDLDIDQELQTLLLEIYECLNLTLTVEIHGGTFDQEEILSRSANIFAALQDKLGDYLTDQTQIPTSVELGFDIVESLFQMGVKQRIDNIDNAINTGNIEQIATVLKSESEVFIGLSQSLNLPGFGAIAQNTILALENNPDQILAIAQISLRDYQKAKAQVLEGDRIQGGEPSTELLRFAGGIQSQNQTEILPVEIVEQEIINPEIHQDILAEKLAKFREFLGNETFNQQPLKNEKADFYIKVINLCLQWFKQRQNIANDELSLDLIVPKITETSVNTAENLANYINDWLDEMLAKIHQVTEGKNLYFYRQGTIFTVILAVAKYQHLGYIETAEDYLKMPLINILKQQIITIANNYKLQPKLTESEKNWLENAEEIMQKHNENNLSLAVEIEGLLPAEDEGLVAQIWGQTTIEEPEKITEFEENNQEEQIINITEIEEKQTTEPPVVALQISKTQIQTQPVQETQVSRYSHPQDGEIVEEDVTVQSQNQSEPTQGKAPSPRQSVRVDLEELQRLNYLTGNLLINQNRQILQDQQVQELVEEQQKLIRKHQQTLNQLRDWSNLMSTQPDHQRLLIANQKQSETPVIRYHQGQNSLPQFDWLEFDNYTEIYSLFNTALEETLQISALTENIEQISKQLHYTLEKQQRLLSHVRDDLTAVQMSPLSDIFGRFPRMIAQLSTSKNKPVEIKITGGQVLVDKAIAEKLYDPLLHIIRNAFDHGIESSEIRVEQGKLATGKIEIIAYHSGNHTIIEVRDDGKGLDFEAIRNKAIEKNFVTVETAQKLTKSELLDLLFQPGFSTAKTLSDISGRGIGLDIVRTQLNALKGAIRVESQPQIGTTFMLKIPFSLTTAKFFICQAGNSTYALLSESIMKIILPNPAQIQEFEGKKVLQYGSNKDVSLVPIYQLSQMIKYHHIYADNHPYFLVNNKEQIQTNNQLTNLFLLKGNAGVFALEIDQIIGEQELVIRPVGNAIASPNYIFGCSILGDGRLILAIDGTLLVEKMMLPKFEPLPNAKNVNILSGDNQKLSNQKLLKEETTDIDRNEGQKALIGSGLKVKNLLVIDDSMSHRQTLSLNLEKAGYKVYQAQDGLDGLEKLQENPDVNVIICDLEMPKMNGFEFLNQWRQNGNFAKIPVIILTSRNSEKHRMLALQLGAKAYFTKPYFEEDFLNKIAQVCE
jgi:two-component system, chemotaxis family, sensor histidine kinase and response regulator PixL